jgi:hypothetical protein
VIVNLYGHIQNEVGMLSHWEMFEQFRLEENLFDQLHSEVTRRVSVVINSSQASSTIDARQLGASVLADLSSWWHGEFPRRFPGFPNGSERGIFGMVLWNYLALQPDVWWCFAEQKDAHRHGQNAMRYWMLQPGDPLIPANRSTLALRTLLLAIIAAICVWFVWESQYSGSGAQSSGH